MERFTYGLGKGLREPVSPFREAYFFGAELNEPSADNWNGIPVIVQKATSFDLSRISYGHEVVVAFLGIPRAVEGEYHITFRWYRARDNTLLYDFTHRREATAGGWLYAYSYLGWVAWEIRENGDYRVDIAVTGAESYSLSITFTVSGIPEEIPEPVPSVGFMTPIVSWLGSARDFFEDLGHDIAGVPIIGDYLAMPFLFIGNCFDWLAYYTSQAAIWVSDTTGRVATILSSTDIFFLLWTWLGYAQDAWDWVRDSFSNVWDIVDTWWSSTRDTVQAWIDEAKNLVLGLIANIQSQLAGLQSAWDDFKGMIPTLDEVIRWWHNWPGELLSVINSWWTSTMVEVQDLIDSAFVTREQFWSGWQDWRDKVTEFFTDPEEWLYKAADRIIERFW